MPMPVNLYRSDRVVQLRVILEEVDHSGKEPKIIARSVQSRYWLLDSFEPEELDRDIKDHGGLTAERATRQLRREGFLK